MSTTTAIIKQIESLGYAVSVQRVNDTVEMHAVKVPEGEPVWMARNADGDGEQETYLAVCELARMVGIRIN